LNQYNERHFFEQKCYYHKCYLLSTPLISKLTNQQIIEWIRSLPFRIGSTYHFFEQNVVLKNVSLISLDTFAISPSKSQIKNSQQHFKTLDVVGIKVGVIFLNKILSLKVS
jgi:hypothetical protein